MLYNMGTDLRVDPGIEKWATMRGRTIEYFRMTPKNFALGIFTLGIIPAGLYYCGVKYQVSTKTVWRAECKILLWQTTMIFNDIFAGNVGYTRTSGR